MKTTLRALAAVAALAIATPALAQGGPPGGGMGQMSPEQRLARQKDMLFRGITLSADQSAKADTLIMQGMRKQMEAMQAARSGSGDMASMQVRRESQEHAAGAPRGPLSRGRRRHPGAVPTAPATTGASATSPVPLCRCRH